MQSFIAPPPSVNSKVRPILLAHRGYWGEIRQQNSAEAIVAAAKAGAQGCELDLRLSADGEVVLCHDPDFRGHEIADTPYFGSQGLKELGILNLQAALQVSVGQLLNLEIKSDPNNRTKFFASKIADACAEKVHDGSILFSSFELPTILAIREVAPSAPLALLLGETDRITKGIRSAKDSALAGVNIHFRKANKKNLDLATELGLSVGVWTVDNEHLARTFSNYPVAVIITNRTPEIKEILNEATS